MATGNALAIPRQNPIQQVVVPGISQNVMNLALQQKAQENRLQEQASTRKYSEEQKQQTQQFQAHMAGLNVASKASTPEKARQIYKTYTGEETGPDFSFVGGDLELTYPDGTKISGPRTAIQEVTEQVAKDPSWLTDPDKAMKTTAWMAARGVNIAYADQGKPTYRTGIDPTTGQRTEFAVSGSEATPVKGMLPEEEKITPQTELGKINLDEENQKITPEQAQELRDKSFKVTGKEDFAQAKDLRSQFVKLSTDFIKVRDSYNRVDASAQDPSAAGDLAMIFNYMKILDPGSVVRESEFATAAASGGYGERLKAAGERILRGQRLSEEMRNDFVDRGKRLYEKQLETHQNLRSEYDRLAKEFYVEPSHVIVDFLNKESGVSPEEQGEQGTVNGWSIRKVE